MQYGSFGDILFEIMEYYEHTEENEYIYARKHVIKPPSTTQWLGVELGKVKLKIKLHQLVSEDPELSYEMLKYIASKGKAKTLIIAEQVKGNYVIDKIIANYTQTDFKGRGIVIEVEIEMTEYIKKDIQTIQNKRTKQKSKKIKKQQKGIARNQPSYKIIEETNKSGYKYKKIVKDE